MSDNESRECRVSGSDGRLIARRQLELRRILYYVTHKPALLARILNATAISAFTKRIPHWQTSISLTEACNMNCEHCFSKLFTKKAKQNQQKELTTDEIIGFIKETLELGVFAFDLQGGEVFLHPDLEDIILACEPSRSHIGIITNGTLFNESWALKLKRLGVDKICVSIDSGIEKEHDDFRRSPGTWKQATNAVDLALKFKFRVYVLTTVTHENLHSEGVTKIREYCIKKKVRNWLFIAIPVGNWRGKQEFLIDEKDHEFIADLNRRSRGLIARDISPHMFGFLKGCPAVTEAIHMTSYGDVMPCPFTHISLGNIRDHRLKDIIDRALTIEEFRTNKPVCLIGEDREFIRKYGHKTFESDEGPLDGEEVLGFESKLSRRNDSGT